MLTRINAENIRFFEGLLGPFVREQGESQLLIGGVDEDGEAVSACVLSAHGKTLFIEFFGVTPPRQRMGAGNRFLMELAEHAHSCGFSFLESIYYKEADEESVWEEFLKDAGFQTEEMGVIRRGYSFAKVQELLPETEEELPGECRIKRGQELSPDEALELYAIAANREEKGIYADADSIISKENRYGGVLFEDGKVQAAVSAMPLAGDVRIDTILVDLQALKNIGYLMRYVIRQAEGERKLPSYIWLESAADELSEKIMKLYTRMAPPAERTQQAVRAFMEV